VTGEVWPGFAAENVNYKGLEYAAAQRGHVHEQGEASQRMPRF
jgi:hypothetical protein